MGFIAAGSLLFERNFPVSCEEVTLSLSWTQYKLRGALITV
jgi:hypothetical protein